MKTLRWKPLRSSVKQARSLTGILDGINLFVSALIVLLGVFGLSIGQFVAGLVCILLGVVTYLIFIMAYIALELLTEIADDTRLQLMAVAGDEYDQWQAQDESLVKSSGTDGLTQAAERYNAAVIGYRRYGGRECSFDNSTCVLEDVVVLRDPNGEVIMTMVLYDCEWTRA